MSRDLPEGKTVCASCHAPGVGAGQPGLDDISEVSGINKLGVHCDFCHKVEGVKKGEVGFAHGRDLLRLSLLSLTHSRMVGDVLLPIQMFLLP